MKTPGLALCVKLRNQALFEPGWWPIMSAKTGQLRIGSSSKSHWKLTGKFFYFLSYKYYSIKKVYGSDSIYKNSYRIFDGNICFGLPWTEKSGFYTMSVAFTRAQTTELILSKLTENMYSILDRWYVNLYVGASNCFENFFKIHPSIQ